MIGIFDSGSGGLTVLKAIRERLPSVDVTYFGDIKNAPYGSKNRTELSRLTFSAIERLTKLGATSIVSACNSVSSSLAVSLLDAGEIAPERMMEMVGPTARYFKHADSRIVLLATQATIDSGIYQSAFAMVGKEITALPVPGLAGAIEFGSSEEEIEKIIRDTLAQVPEGSYSVLILACTHYPLVMPLFERILGDTVLIFDPADAVAERIEKEWWPREAGKGTVRLLVSKDSEPFRRYAAEVMGTDAYTIEVIE